MVRPYILTCILLASGCTGVQMGTEYFVSPGGDDSAAGTSEAAAFKTIRKAAQTAQAGDIVTILPGTYQERVRPSHSGTAQAPVIFRGTGEVILTTDPKDDGGEWLERPAFKISNKNHIIIENITFKDAESWIYIGDDAQHNTVRNCVFNGCRIYHGIFINNGCFTRILNCRFIKGQPLAGDWEETNQHANLVDYIAIWRGSHHNLVEGCYFTDVTHDCIMIMGFGEDHSPANNIVRNNNFYDVKWKPLGLHSDGPTLVENNMFTGTAACFVQFQGSRTIMRNNVFRGLNIVRTKTKDGKPFVIPEDFKGALWLRSIVDEYGGMELAQHNRIYNNVFYNNERTVTYRANSNSPNGILPVADNIFRNNIFYRNRQSLRLPHPFYAHFSTQRVNYLYNNIVVQEKPGEKVVELCKERIDEETAYTLTEAESALAAFSAATQAKPVIAEGNLETAPVFSGPDQGNFGLADGSPGKGQGSDLTVTRSAGSGSEVPVKDALPFCDGYRLIRGDRVVIGVQEPVTVTKVDHNLQVLTIDRDLSWQEGDPVNLEAGGTRPDIGLLDPAVIPGQGPGK